MKDFLRIMIPLTQLMRKDVSFVWNKECEDIFLELKNQLITTPILAIPLGSKRFIIFSNASHQGLGCLLMQGDT